MKLIYKQPVFFHVLHAALISERLLNSFQTQQSKALPTALQQERAGLFYRAPPPFHGCSFISAGLRFSIGVDSRDWQGDGWRGQALGYNWALPVPVLSPRSLEDKLLHRTIPRPPASPCSSLGSAPRFAFWSRLLLCRAAGRTGALKCNFFQMDVER